MATANELSKKILKRFKGVPNVTEEDTAEWLERSFMEHGMAEGATVPREDELLILLYAEWDGAIQLSLQTAYYFEYKDAEESVDKKTISEQYRKVAGEIWSRYQREKIDRESQTGSRFTIMTRADR